MQLGVDIQEIINKKRVKETNKKTIQTNNPPTHFNVQRVIPRACAGYHIVIHFFFVGGIKSKI